MLDKLNPHQPAIIGLDIYRDLPLEPGNPELVTNLQLTDNIIAVCKSGNGDRDRGVAPPKEVPIERLGFSDIVVDSDSVVRLGQPVLNSDIYALGIIGIQALVGSPALQIPKDWKLKK